MKLFNKLAYLTYKIAWWLSDSRLKQNSQDSAQDQL